ncbi:MAG: hypothetical protein SAJ12_09680 [Jaaginema sp. PMC 1079.18]|nr:hypothetical protein [Jaaginema sp. PMC 1080.18]MEC4851270.1 hypothetical protein [Jaaginema sp. PMC 1079.18]MEC4868029.1 hypothetical protein [Jaaginema sp. PMC 1078.18]
MDNTNPDKQRNRDNSNPRNPARNFTNQRRRLTREVRKLVQRAEDFIPNLEEQEGDNTDLPQSFERLDRQLEGLKVDAEWGMLKERDRALLDQAEIMLNNYLKLIAEIREIAPDSSPE